MNYTAGVPLPHAGPMSDVLSQNDVESLLAALDPTAGPERAAFRDAGGEELISVYDFKRPERVSKEQMRALQGLHEGFSREFGAGLSGLLRTIVEVKLVAVDQLTYSEFVFSLENPTCFNLLACDGLEGSLILDLTPAIVYPVCDRLLGGGKNRRQAPPDRPLTEIELRLVSRITDLATAALDNAWSNLTTLRSRVTRTESNPQLVQIVPPNEVVVLVSFEIALGETRGIMNLCIPFNSIESVVGKLSGDAWSAYSQKEADPRERVALDAGVSRAPVRVTVRLAGTTLTAREIADLGPGDVILTDADRRGGLEVSVEGRPTFLCEPGLLKGKRAVRITGRVARARDRIAELVAAGPRAA